ncbi:MAG: FAD-dependent oxidoreductase [Deltaproteobacteria bacterium]|nr:FAD-dependent oxidoreductase [Deltaproteobacteria bacterium]
MQDVDVAVIGAGPAGMAAAIRAREAGAEHVVLMERAEELGGLLHQCVHNGFGLLYFKEDLTGPEYGHRFIEKVMDTGVTPLLETMVVRLGKDRQIGAVNTKEGFITFRPRSIVLAMGCRERSRGALNIPGSRPAGVLTAGTAQRFVNVEGFVPGKRVVILGSGDIGMIMARRLTLEGARVEAVVEILPYIGGLIRNEVQCIHDFEIPLFLSHTVTQIHGEERVEAVTVAQVNGNRQPVAGTQRTIECDTLLLSVGLIPENELSIMAGIQLDPVTGGALVDETRQTNIPGVFAGGNVLHVHDLVDNVSWESELAGESAARFAVEGKQEGRGDIRVKAGRNIRYIVPQTISGRRDTTLYMRVSEPEEAVRIKVGDIMTKGVRAVKPSEMLKIELSAEKLQKLQEGTEEITVDCEKRGGK